ncbi:hypothetical protein RQP54_11455 [Curvibacter sp. APW13]|uniref:hypothetical protein n=1 Tax=Curvibacter sp. APW13 TaxID=3077236 RepID=UPI0028DDF551|nr:hypothetical protein [Curvibacter sp. APW13]MDT8991477.1 hypothetical protein [Curvibacter sp. APW13]
MVKLAGIVPYAHRIAMLDSPKYLRHLRMGAVCAAGVVLLGGCARLSDAAQNMFVSVTPAVATVGDQVLTGTLHVYNDATGFVALEGDVRQAGALRCSGSMPVAGFMGRDIYLRCNNGVQARVALSLRTELRGFGFGADADTPVGLAFGLEPPEVLALLKWPAQWRLYLQEGRYQIALADPMGKPLPPAEAAGKP